MTEEPGVNHSRFAFGDIDRGHAYIAVPKSLAPSTRSLKEVGMRGGRGDPAYGSPLYQRVWAIIVRTGWAGDGCPLNAPPFDSMAYCLIMVEAPEVGDPKGLSRFILRLL